MQYSAGQRRREEHTQLTLLSPSQLTNVTLAHMIPQSFQESFKEEEHLQPVLIELLQTALSAARGDCVLLDTHKCSNQLHGPIARPACIFVASGPKPLWTQVVSLFEFKIGDSKTEIQTMFVTVASEVQLVATEHGIEATEPPCSKPLLTCSFAAAICKGQSGQSI